MMKTTQEILLKLISPFQKTFEPDGDNLYIENNVRQAMKIYAKEAIIEFVKELKNRPGVTRRDEEEFDKIKGKMLRKLLELK